MQLTYRTHLTLLITAILMLTLSFSPLVWAEDNDKSDKPHDGELVLPSDYQSGEEKKCMTVCQEWGENCIINPATGSRKCRRVCKSFAEECF